MNCMDRVQLACMQNIYISSLQEVAHLINGQRVMWVLLEIDEPNHIQIYLEQHEQSLYMNQWYRLE